jgi:hypothetical protein
LEETGVRGKIIRSILLPPEEIEIRDEYYLMKPIEDTGQFDEETQAIVWATKPEAEELISMTEDLERRERDLKVLRFAFEIFGSVNGSMPLTQDDKEDLR